jgi:tetratricopeptide (TPR) repeat protein
MFWDDNDGILNNKYTQEFAVGKFFSENLVAGTGIESNYWRPLLLIIYGLEWQVWGAWAYGYHAINFLIHFANALLIFILLEKTLKKRRLAFFSALIFLIHPLQTEAVTYVSGLGDPLSLMFILIGMLAYFRFKTDKPKILQLCIALTSFILALLSKERAVIFPAFLILINIWILLSEKPNWKKWIIDTAKSILPFILIATIYLLLRGTALNFVNTFNIYNIESDYTLHISTRILTFFSVLPHYIGLTIFPKTLFMERSENIAVITNILNPAVLTGITLTLIATLFAISKLKEKPIYAFAVLFFAIAIFPASGILVPVAGLMFEHYMYAPIIGLALFVGAFLEEMANSQKSSNFYIKQTGNILLILWMIFICTRTIMRNAEWRTPIKFYEQTLAHAPTSMRVWNNLGMAYSDSQKFENAVYAYNRAIELSPKNAIPYYNLGNLLENSGDLKSAKILWEKALEIDPDFHPARMRLLET